MANTAGKARYLAWIFRKLKGRFPDDPDEGGSEVRDRLVATFNALTLPSAYLYVDPDMLCHVVMIKSAVSDKEIKRHYPHFPMSMEVSHSADVIWTFDPATGIWNTLKDRTGDFERICPLKCGGVGQGIPSKEEQ